MAINLVTMPDAKLTDLISRMAYTGVYRNYIAQQSSAAIAEVRRKFSPERLERYVAMAAYGVEPNAIGTPISQTVYYAWLRYGLLTLEDMWLLSQEHSLPLVRDADGALDSNSARAHYSRLRIDVQRMAEVELVKAQSLVRNAPVDTGSSVEQFRVEPTDGLTSALAAKAGRAATKYGKAAATTAVASGKEALGFGVDVAALASRMDSLNTLLREYVGKGESHLFVAEAQQFWKDFKLGDRVHEVRLDTLRKELVRQLSQPESLLLEKAHKNQDLKKYLTLMQRAVKSPQNADSKSVYASLHKALADIVQRYKNIENATTLAVGLLVLMHQPASAAAATAPTVSTLQKDALSTFFGAGFGATGEEILIKCASIVGERLYVLAAPMNAFLQARPTSVAQQQQPPMKIYQAANMHSSVEDLQRFGATGLPHPLEVVPLLSVQCSVSVMQKSTETLREMGHGADTSQFTRLEASVVQLAMAELHTNADLLLKSLKERRFTLDLRPLDTERIALPTGLFAGV